MLANLKTKDKILLIVIAIGAIFALFWNFVLSPLRTENKDLATKRDTRQKAANAITQQISDASSLDSNIVASKVQVMELSNVLISQTEPILLFDSLSKTFFLYTTETGATRQLAYTSTDPAEITNNPRFTMGQVVETTVKIPNNDELVDATLINTTVDINFYARQSGINGLYDDAFTLISIIENNYKYMSINNFSFKEPNQSVGDNGINTRYSININVTIYMASGNFENYRVGTCPHINDDGTICGEHNEFTASICTKCGTSIDNCPNSDCGILIEIPVDNSTVVCQNCNSALEKCIHCGELIHMGSSKCVKCNQYI